VTIEKSFACERRNVLHDRRSAGEANMILNFTRAGSDAFLALFALNKIEYASLAIGQHLRETMQRIGASASSNEHGLPAKMIRLTREMTPKGTQACGLCAQRVSQPADLGIGQHISGVQLR